MSTNIDFRRFDRQTKEDQFSFESTDRVNELEHAFSHVSMGKLGFNVSVNVQNFTDEDVFMGGSLRTRPTRLPSLRRDGGRLMDHQNNYVLVTVCSSTVTNSQDPKRKVTHNRKTEIRIPSKMLNRGSVFIDELDMYISAESQIDATRELIARDAYSTDWDSINIPQSMSKQDPAITYGGYKDLVKRCIERQDKIQIRIGVDTRYDEVPEVLKTMRVAILDSYFVPYDCYKLVFDPTLDPDDFIVENIYSSSKELFEGKLSVLEQAGTIYLDYNKTNTLFGDFYGLALFSDQRQYVNYVHRNKSQERFNDETLHVASRTGDPRLREQVDNLKEQLEDALAAKGELEETTISLRKDIVRLKGNVKDLEENINKIRSHHDTKFSSEVVLKTLDNERDRIGNDSVKIGNERLDIGRQEKTSMMAYKASFLKTISEILKSGWVIVTGCIGGILSIIALCKKYNVKISMAT